MLAASGWSVTIVSVSYCQPELMLLMECLGKKHSGKSPHLTIFYGFPLNFQYRLASAGSNNKNTKQGRGKDPGFKFDSLAQ